MRLVVTDWSGALASAESWEAIRRVAPTETVFLTPDWLETWWRHLGPLESPSIFGMRDRALAGLAPLFRSRLGGTDFVALRQPGARVADYLDLLLPSTPADRMRCLETFVDGLVTRPRAWDLLDLTNLPGESPTVVDLPRVARSRGLSSATMAGYGRPAIALEGSWEDYLSTRPGRFRYSLRSRLKRLGNLGQVCFRRVTSAAELSPALESLVALHAKRWSGQRTQAIFSSSASGREFYAEACHRYLKRGMLDLRLLELDGHPVAGAVGLVDRGTFYYYMPAFDPDYAVYGPSSLLLAHLIEGAFRSGLRRFDFMIGEEAYKADWATESRATVRLVVGHGGPHSRAAVAWVGAWHEARIRARKVDLIARVRRYGPRAVTSLILSRLAAVIGRSTPGR